MFTQIAAFEQSERNSNNTIIAFSPGVMDTNMQEQIRSTSKEAFKDLDRFKGYEEKNILLPVENVANALVDLLLSKDVDSGKVYNVKDLLK